MCFFKPRIPKIETPQVMQAAPAIRETTAPTPEAPVFGSGVTDLVESETATKGVKGLKVPKLEKPAGIASTTGASKNGFNVYRS